MCLISMLHKTYFPIIISPNIKIKKWNSFFFYAATSTACKASYSYVICYYLGCFSMWTNLIIKNHKNLKLLNSAGVRTLNLPRAGRVVSLTSPCFAQRTSWCRGRPCTGPRTGGTWCSGHSVTSASRWPPSRSTAQWPTSTARWRVYRTRRWGPEFHQGFLYMGCSQKGIICTLSSRNKCYKELSSVFITSYSIC